MIGGRDREKLAANPCHGIEYLQSYQIGSWFSLLTVSLNLQGGQSNNDCYD